MRKQAMDNFKSTGIYALTAEKLSRGRSNLEVIDAMIQAGIKFIQYREKEKNANVMYKDCLAIRQMTRKAGVTLIIDDFVDLALAVKADGVHIGQKDLPPQVVRKLIGEDMVMGLSTHCLTDIRQAETSGIVDYIGVGPIFTTQTKKDVCAAVGLEYVRAAASESRLPFVAIGGIKEHNIGEVVKAGASTIAVVSDIVGAEDICGKIRKLLEIMKR